MKLSTLESIAILALGSFALSACSHDIYRQDYGYNWRAYRAPAAATDAAGSPTTLILPSHVSPSEGASSAPGTPLVNTFDQATVSPMGPPPKKRKAVKRRK